MPSFSISFDCDIRELTRLRQALADWLSAERVADRTGFEVRLVAHEAAKNAIAHAEPCDAVSVRASIVSGEIVVEVEDTGREPWELEPIAGGGELRGLTLIHTLASRVETIHHDDGTTLRIRIPSEPRRRA